MIQELKNKIDVRLSLTPKAKLNKDTERHWQCYSECKKIVQEYEDKKRVYFQPHEYGEYIDYITAALNI